MLEICVHSFIKDCVSCIDRVFGVDQRVLFLFYQAVLESLVRYGMPAWYDNLAVQLKTKLTRLVHTAMKVIGRSDHQSLQEIYDQSVLRQVKRSVTDPSHVLHPDYELLPPWQKIQSSPPQTLPFYKLSCTKL